MALAVAIWIIVYKDAIKFAEFFSCLRILRAKVTAIRLGLDPSGALGKYFDHQFLQRAKLGVGECRYFRIPHDHCSRGSTDLAGPAPPSTSTMP